MINKKEYTPESIYEWHYRMSGHIEHYDKIGIVRSISGVVCVGVGVATLPLPTGSIFVIGLGCYLLGYDSKILLPKLIYKGKNLLNWFYCNRTPKKIVQTLKTRLLVC